MVVVVFWILIVIAGPRTVRVKCSTKQNGELQTLLWYASKPPSHLFSSDAREIKSCIHLIPHICAVIIAITTSACNVSHLRISFSAVNFLMTQLASTFQSSSNLDQKSKNDLCQCPKEFELISRNWKCNAMRCCGDVNKTKRCAMLCVKSSDLRSSFSSSPPFEVNLFLLADAKC